MRSPKPIRRNLTCLWLRAAGLVLLGVAGCVPPPLKLPAEPVVVRPVPRAVTVWPTVVVDEVPGHFAPPWPWRAGAELELWQIDLLDLDRPDLMAWLEAWQPRRERLARPVPIEGAPASPGRVRLEQRGAYVLRARTGDEADVALVLASRIRTALVLEEDDCEVLCADAQTGRPVRGAYVQLVYRTERLGRERTLSVSGPTDADGRWHCSLVRDRFAPAVAAAAVACHGSDYALATERRVLDHCEANHRITLRARGQTFRPGQTAELAGVLQARSAGSRRFAAWGDAQLRLLLLDPAGLVAGIARARTDEVGAFAVAFELGSDAPPGPYVVAATVQGAAQFELRRLDAFSVVRATPVPFRLRLSLDRSVVAPGETLGINVEATRADGTAVSGARVRLLTWGHPTALDGAGENWAADTAPLNPARAVVLPVALPPLAETDAQGRLSLRWQPTLAELPGEDLLCGVHVEVLAPDLGAAERSAEFVLLAPAPPVEIGTNAGFFRPGEQIELTFASTLPQAVQAVTQAVCTVTHEDDKGAPHVGEIARAPIAWFVKQRLTSTATNPGRYAFCVRAGGAASSASVWVMEDERDVLWSGSPEPALFPERPWVQRGEGLRTVVAAPGRDAPLAMTLRSGSSVTRRTLPLHTGARGLRLHALPNYGDSVEVSLAQVSARQAWVGRMSIGVEPGGRALEVLPRLLWVRQGEWSGRGYGITTHDRLGRPVPTVVHIELVRPSFHGSPPAGIQRRTVHWHSGKATNEAGEIEVGFHDSLLASATTLLVEGVAPDGRSGVLLMPIRTPSHAPALEAGRLASPRERLGTLAQHGLDTPLAQWLAGRLLAAHPELAADLPGLLAAAKSDDEAIAIAGMAVAHPSAAAAAVGAALRRGGPVGPAALALAADRLADLRPVFEDSLAHDANPLVRAAAARALARALPTAREALANALCSDEDPIARAAAAAALGRGGQAAVPALAEAAQRDSAATVRIAAVQALRQAGGAPAAAVLLGLVGDPSEEIAVAAIRALGEIGYGGADPRLIRLLGLGSPGVRMEAARLLTRTESPEVVRQVLAAARRAPTGPLVRALVPLRSRPVQAAAAGWLSHDDPDVQLAAAECLAAVQDERAPAALRKFLEPGAPASSADRAAAALLALRDTAAVPKLLALLDTERLSPGTRQALVQTAGDLGLQEAGPALIAILWRGLAEPHRLAQQDDRQLWLRALDAVSAIGPVWSPVIEGAVGPIPSASPYAPALAALRSQGLAAFLAELWRSPLPDELRRHTVVPYARLRGSSGQPQLVALLESPVLQGPAMRALAEAGAVDALSGALRSLSPVTRAAAAAALGATGEARAVPGLQPLLADGDPFVRCEAAHALAAITRQAVAYTDCLGEARQAGP